MATEFLRNSNPVNDRTALGAGIEKAAEGPQLLTALKEQLHNMYEHRAQIRSINIAVRGHKGGPAQPASEAPEKTGVSLIALVEEIHRVNMDIRNELLELGNHLS